MLLVVAPALALELPRRQVLLEAARLVVEAEEKRLRIQLLEQLRVAQQRQLLRQPRAGVLGGQRVIRVLDGFQRH